MPTRSAVLTATATLLVLGAIGAGQSGRAQAPGDAADSAALITRPMKEAIKDKFARSLILPELALWKFDFTRPYPTGGLSVCGRVNYALSTREYIGDQPFFGLFRDGKLVSAVIVAPRRTTPMRSTDEAYAIACGTPK